MTSPRAFTTHDQFDKDVTPDQQKARAAVCEVIDAASNLAAGTAPAAYAPDRVVVYDVGLGYGDKTATTMWPGPPPGSFLTPSNQSPSVACGYLSGPPATVVYTAALNNPGALWLVDGSPPGVGREPASGRRFLPLRLSPRHGAGYVDVWLPASEMRSPPSRGSSGRRSPQRRPPARQPPRPGRSRRPAPPRAVGAGAVERPFLLPFAGHGTQRLRGR